MIANIESAKSLFDQKRFKETIYTCKEILKKNKTSIDVLKLIALTLSKTNELQDAIFYYNKALDIKPNDHEIIKDLGNVYIALGEKDKAKEYYKKSLSIKIDYAPALSNIALLELNNQKVEDAIRLLKRATSSDPKLNIAWINLANTYCLVGKIKEAKDSYLKSIELEPKIHTSYFLLANILIKERKLNEAELHLRKAIELKPDFANAYANLGFILTELDNLEEAEVAIYKSIEINPKSPEFHLNLGVFLLEKGKLKEAESSTRKAIELNPSLAKAYCNLGRILLELGKLKEAKISILKSIEYEPDLSDSYFNLSLIELLEENYESGLKNYEFRSKKNRPSLLHAKPKIKHINEHEFKTEQKLLVISEQGLGDTIQFMRYIPILKNKGFDVKFCALPKLHSLIIESGIDTNPLTPEEANSISEGKWIRLLSIPRYLQINPKSQIISNPYIHSSYELVEKWRKIFSKEKGPIIALNWQGDPKSEKGHLKGRSIPLEAFCNICRNKNLKFISLQKGFGSEQLAKCSFRDKFVNFQEEIECIWDFLEIGAIISNCDLVITSDTSVAHLAGGMGKPTWLLLKDIPEWRWGLKSNKTFWYPSMTLFRQEEKNNWSEVIERVPKKIKEDFEF